MAEMKLFVKQLKRTITGRESGSNKQTASKSCALSLVRQLYHLGVIEAFSGSIRVDRELFASSFEKKICQNTIFIFPSAEDQLASYPVRISPDLVNRLECCLKDLNIQPVSVHYPLKSENDEEEQPVSLLVRNKLLITRRNHLNYFLFHFFF